MHLNRVLYKKEAGVNHYRQIAVVESSSTLELRIFGGTVILDPKFIPVGTDAEVYFHDTLKTAWDGAEQEFQQSVNSGEWVPYNPVFPPK